MDKRQVFFILGIEETREEDVIREAYHRLLPLHHPEEDQEGFRLIREAYEDAIRLAQEPEEADGDRASTAALNDNPGSARHFLAELDELYSHVDRRIRRSEWERLLKQPGVVDLDTEEDIKRALFIYLADHFHIPSKIWELLEQRYQIRENYQAFVEFLPESFVDFMLHESELEETAREFPFEALKHYPEHDKEGVVDEFIGMYFQAVRAMETEETWGTKDLAALEAIGISHPWFEMLRLRASLREGNTDGILEKMNRLLEEYPDDWKIRCDVLDACMEAGFDEELERLSKEILEQEDGRDLPAQYRAHWAMGELAGKQEKWKEAFQSYEAASGIIYSNELDRRIEEAGKRFILACLEKEELEDEEKVLLLEAYDLTGWHEKGIDFFERFPENIVDTAEFHYGLACLYDSAGRFEETGREIAIGRELLERDRQPGAEEDGKYNRHLAIFLLLEASTVLQRPGGEYDEAMELISEAEKLIPGIGASMKIRILRQRGAEGDAEQIVEECEKLLKEDPEDLNALKYMQEAYEMQGMAQEVVDLYERIRVIYAQDSEIYERAVRAFAAYGMYADVRRVISEAEESGALNRNLRMKKYYAAGMISQSKEEWQAAVQEAGALIKELTQQVEMEQEGDRVDTMPEQEADRETLGCAYLYRAMLYRDPKLVKENPPIANLLDEELSDLKHCLEYCDLNDAHYCIGQVYSDKEDQEPDAAVRTKWADKAYEHLSIAAQRGRKNPWIYAVLADYSEIRDQYQDAIHYMTGALEMLGEDDNWTRRQYKRLVFWFRYLYDDTLLEDYAEQALQYADLSDEKYGETIEVHMDRGRVYNRQGRRREAVREWSRALELLEEAEDSLYNTKRKGWAYNGMGNAYRYMHDYEQAIKAYDCARAVLDVPELCGESYAEYPYEAISNCYLYWKKEREGIIYYKKCLEEKTEANSNRTEKGMELILEALIDLSCSVGEYEDAIRYMKQRYGSLRLTEPVQEPWNWQKESDRLSDILWYRFSFPEAFSGRIEDMYMAAMDVVKQKGVPEASSDRTTLSGYADYLENLGEDIIILGLDDAAAKRYLEEALEVRTRLQDDSKCYNLYEQLMWACYFTGDREQAKTYAQQCIRAWELETEPCQALHISLEEAAQHGWIYAKASIFYLGQCYIGKGDLNKAKECVEKMETCPLCANCEHTVCFEQLALQAAIAYFEGDVERAQRLCDATEEVLWSGHFSLTTLLRNRMKKRTVN